MFLRTHTFYVCKVKLVKQSPLLLEALIVMVFFASSSSLTSKAHYFILFAYNVC